MSAYQTVVVGTDGSDSSLRAVDRAGAIAADHGAKLIVATAHLPVPEEHGGWSVPPGSTHGQDYRMVGEAPIYAILRDARERAHKAGAKNVEEKPIVGAPINALVHLAGEVHADLLVVGNVGLSSVNEPGCKAPTGTVVAHLPEPHRQADWLGYCRQECRQCAQGPDQHNFRHFGQTICDRPQNRVESAPA